MDSLVCQIKAVLEEKVPEQKKMEATIRIGQEGMKTGIKALMDAHLEQLNACHENMTVGLEAMKACLGKTEARLQTFQEEIEAEFMPELEEMNVIESEANQEKIEAVAEYQQVPYEEAVVEIVGAPQNRYGDQQQRLYCRLRSLLSRRGFHCAIA
jgi:hypothetical protein